MPEAKEIAALLEALRSGDSSALDRLVPLVYDEMRMVAHQFIRRGRRGPVLNTTALVHEAYLKLAKGGPLHPLNRGQFLALSATAMRQVVVDFARAQAAQKRGGVAVQVELGEGSGAVVEHAERVLEIDVALQRLRAWSERLARVVECRFFAGLTEEETAETLGISRRTAQREWTRARAWLEEELAEEA